MMGVVSSTKEIGIAVELLLLFTLFVVVVVAMRAFDSALSRRLDERSERTSSQSLFRSSSQSAMLPLEW